MQSGSTQITTAMDPVQANINVNTLVFHDPTDTEMTPEKVVILCIMTTSNVFMLLGNGFSIYIITQSPSLRQHTYYWLVLNLAVLDLMNSMFVVPINIVWEFYGYWPFSSVLCNLEIFCDLGFSIVAAYSTVLLALDKYLYIIKPFFYYRFVGPKSTLASILLTWIVWLTYSAVSVFGGLARSTKEYKYDFPLDRCNFVLKHSYAITSFILVFFIPLCLLLFTSSRILCVARQHIRKIHTNHPSISMTTSQDFSTLINASTAKVLPSSCPPSPKHLSDRQQKSSSAVPNRIMGITPTASSTLPTSSLAMPKPASALPTSPLAVPQTSSILQTRSSSSGSTTSTVSTVYSETPTGLPELSVTSIPPKAIPANADSEECTHDKNPAQLPNTNRSQTAMNRKENTSTANPGSKKKTSTLTPLRAFGTVTLVVVAYVVMFAPYWLATIVNLGCTCIAPLIFEDYLATFYYMHSLVNPYIYMATDRRYKRAIRHLLAKLPCCWRWWRRNSSAPNNIVSSYN